MRMSSGHVASTEIAGPRLPHLGYEPVVWVSIEAGALVGIEK